MACLAVSAAPARSRLAPAARRRAWRCAGGAGPPSVPSAAAAGGGSWRPQRRTARQLWAAASSSEGGGEAADDEGVDLQASFQRAAAAQQALEEYRQLMERAPEWGAVGDHAADSELLLRGAVLIARHRYPLLSHEEVAEQLDDLAVQVEGKLPPADQRYPLRVLQTISEHLYEDRGFRGNKEDYYSPDNSCLNKVLELRTGIPITLGLVYMQVAHRLGLPMVGVNIPAHFFVAPASPDLEFLVDAFDGGAISFQQDVEETLSRIVKQPIALDARFITSREPLPPRLFLARMLNNLKQIYNLRRSFADALAVSRYLLATRPDDLAELRDSGVYLYYLGRIPECIETLSEFVARAPPGSEDVQKVQALLKNLASRQERPPEEAG